MCELFRLILNRLDDLRMAMSSIYHRYSGKTVQILLPFRVLQHRPVALNENDIVPRVHAGHDVLLMKLVDLFLEFLPVLFDQFSPIRPLAGIRVLKSFDQITFEKLL